MSYPKSKKRYIKKTLQRRSRNGDGPRHAARALIKERQTMNKMVFGNRLWTKKKVKKINIIMLSILLVYTVCVTAAMYRAGMPSWGVLLHFAVCWVALHFVVAEIKKGGYYIPVTGELIVNGDGLTVVYHSVNRDDGYGPVRETLEFGPDIISISCNPNLKYVVLNGTSLRTRTAMDGTVIDKGSVLGNHMIYCDNVGAIDRIATFITEHIRDVTRHDEQ